MTKKAVEFECVVRGLKSIIKAGRINSMKLVPFVNKKVRVRVEVIE